MSAHSPDAPATALPAGFWRRFAAWLIDGAIVLAGFFLVGIYLWPDLVLTTTLTSEVDGARLETVRYAPTPLLGAVVLGVVVWAYVALQECGPRQATLGKRALGLKVTGQDGGRVSLLATSVRSWPRWLPGLLGTGGILDVLSALAVVAALAACVAVAFTPRKRGLHDMMARCLVVRRPPGAPGSE